MRSFGSSRWKKVRVCEGGRTEVNEDQSLWKTTDVKDEEFWFLRVEEGKSWGGGRTEVNEDQSLWKTTDVKDEEFWFLKVEE